MQHVRIHPLASNGQNRTAGLAAHRRHSAQVSHPPHLRIEERELEAGRRACL
jgi:hypothetical protein